MRRFYYLFLILLVPAFGQAQQSSQSPSQSQSQAFTLQQCIDYALQNANDVKNAKIDEEIAVAKVRETRGIGLPQVDGAVTLMHNQQLQRFFNQAQVIEGFLGADIPDVAGSDIVAAASPFQLKSAGQATLNATQILFNGSYLVGLQAANAYKDLSVKSSLVTKEQVIANVSKAYYATLINAERLELFDVNISRLDSLLRTTTALNKNGFAEEIDVDRIRVQLNNLKTEHQNIKNLVELSVELLKFQMNYPMAADLTVVGTLEDIEIPESSAQYGQDWSYNDRADFQVLMANRKLQSLNVKNTYAAGLPSLVAFGTYGYSTQSANIGGLFKTETNSSASFPAGIGPDKWYSYSSFGVTLAVPLFSGLQRTYKLQQAKLNLQKVENGVSAMKAGIDLDVKNTSTIYDNSLKSLTSQKENMELARKVARVTKIKYEQGVGSNLEVLDAEAELKNSQNNYYNALYNALLAKVELDKAHGKLREEFATETK
jgi:outer membrane protein